MDGGGEDDAPVNFHLLNFLTDEQLSNIPDEISSKLKEYVSTCLTEKAELSSFTERLKIDLEEAGIELQNSQGRTRILESAEESLSKENAVLRGTVAELQESKTKIELEFGNTEGNRQTLTSLLEKREKEFSEVRDELVQMKNKCEELTSEFSDSRIKQVELESTNSMLQAQYSRKVAECTQLTEEHHTLDSEKLEYMRQISRLQMEKSAELSNHHHSVETVKNDLSNTEQLLETYKQQAESVTEKLRQEQTRHRECRDNFIAAEESHRQELSSQKKLTQMYKEAEQKTSSELGDMHKTASEYKDCFVRLTAEHEELMAQKQSELEEINSILSAKEDHISQIESELARMNELMKESSESPDITAELAKLIKSGLTYSQLYHKYHQTAENLTLSKAENGRLNDCFNTLVKEIDVMKPQVVQLRTAHEASSNMVQKLSEQLKLNLQNLDEEARHASEAKKQLVHSQKECHRFALENEDLANQVQVLTKEVHIAKGGRIIDDDGSAQVSSSTSQFRKSSDVISSQLVSFKDIQDLQKQNQQLRAALREVSEAHDKSENSAASSRVSAKLEQDLANTRQEVEHLKQSRLKQEELVQSIIRQRDMYKELLAQGAMKEAQAKASPKRAITEVDNEKLESLNDELKTSKETITRVNEELQKHKQEQASNERKLYDQIEQLNKDITEQKLNNAKLTTQLDYTLESSKVIEKNVTAYKQEIKALRTKAEQYSNLVAKNESLVASLRQELSHVQQSSVRYEVVNQQLKNDAEVLKALNRRHQADAETAKKDYNLQFQMMSNLQTIQASIQQTNEEMKVHYHQKIEYIEKDKLALAKQLHTVKEDLLSTEKHHAAETANLGSKIEALEQELTRSKEKLLATLEEQKLNRQISGVRGDQSTHTEGSAQQSDFVQSQDLLHANSEIDALKDQLRLSEEASEEYRMAADKLEMTLREQTTASQHFQESLEQKQARLLADYDGLNVRNKDITQKYERVFEQKSKLDTEHAHMQGRLTSEINELKSDLSICKQKLDSKVIVEAKARADLQQASALNEELTSKYQAELEQGIRLSEEVSSVQKEKNSLATRVQELENEVMRTELQLQSNHASFEARERDYKTSLYSLEQELSDGKEQSKRLHEQIEYFSRRNLGEASISQTKGEAGTESEETNTARLLELVKVLRKDKELYETKLEVATAESKRLQAKVTFTEGELSIARGELAGETSQASIDIQTKAQHAELLRKVEQINVLTDSNRMLRQEKDSLQPKIDRLENQVAELNTSITSLESKSTEATLFAQNLEGEKISLQKMVEHWKQKFNSIIERHNRETADETKKHAAELEQLQKTNNISTLQIQRLNAELSKLKASLASAEGEKVKQTKEVEEAQVKLTETESSLATVNEEMVKKEGMVNELRKLGRKYKTMYMKLQEEAKGGTSGEDSKEAESKVAAADETSKLQTEVTTLKETVNAQDDEITKLKEEVEQLKAKLVENEQQLERVQQELAVEKTQHSKINADFKEFERKHITLKDFVSNRLQPKVANQKQDLDKRQKEIAALEASKLHLENQLDEARRNLNEAKARLFSLIEEKSTAGSSAQSGHSTGGVDAKRSQVRTIEVRPMAQLPKQLTATVMPTTSQSEPQEVTTAVPEEPMIGIVSPTSITSPNSTAITTSNSGASSSDAVPVAQLAPSAHSPAQTASSSTPVASAAPIISATAIIHTVQSVSPQTTQTSVVSPQVGIVVSQSTDIPSAAPPSSSTAVLCLNTSAVSPNATVSSATHVVSQVAAVVASQSIPFGAAAAHTSSQNQEDNQNQSTLATSSTSSAGDYPGTSNEAEVRTKRSRNDYEGDNDNDTPMTKRAKDTEESMHAVDDQDQVSQELDSSEYLLQTESADLHTLPTSSYMQEEEPQKDVQQETEMELPSESAQDDMAALAAFADQGPSLSEFVRQEPTYSGSDADVVVIVSSDDDDSQTAHQFRQVGDLPTGDESESEVEASEGDDSESEYVEEQEEGEEADGTDGYEGEEDDDDGSDIIMIDDHAGDSGNASGSVSSSQPSTSTNRRMASLAAAMHYQSQGTVSVDSIINDDGIVPSTPTLALPVSRHDGFAVAVSSPNPSQDPFIFASAAPPSADFADLAQQATIMDDLPQIGDSHTTMAHSEVDGSSADAASSVELPVASTSTLDPFLSDTDSHQFPTASTSMFELPSASTSTAGPTVYSASSLELPTESTDVIELPTESSDVMEFPTESRIIMEAPTESSDVVEIATESSSAVDPSAASTNFMEPPTASTSSEQSNVVSTDSEFQLHSSTGARATTEETVSSSEANVLESVVRSEANQSGQPDMPSSSSQSRRPATARRGRARGNRLNRPTFNKPQ